jgi:hypothetical protein
MGALSVAEMVCRIALDFHRLGNISVLDLLRSSGYLRDPSTMQEDYLENALRSHPELIQEWAKLSEDKMVSSGWYILRPTGSENADWGIGYYPKGQERRFSDCFKACAFFIKQEVESYRSHPTLRRSPQAPSQRNRKGD